MNNKEKRRLSVRGARRSKPDVRRLARVVIEFARAEAEAAAEAQAAKQSASPDPNPTPRQRMRKDTA